MIIFGGWVDVCPLVTVRSARLPHRVVHPAQHDHAGQAAHSKQRLWGSHSVRARSLMSVFGRLGLVDVSLTNVFCRLLTGSLKRCTGRCRRKKGIKERRKTARRKKKRKDQSNSLTKITHWSRTKVWGQSSWKWVSRSLSHSFLFTCRGQVKSSRPTL